MRNPTFLIIDDDPEVYELISEQIFADGRYKFLHAMDAPEALSLLDTHRPDLIVLDLVMPGLTGNDTLVALQQRRITAPVIVATKRGNEAKAIEALRLGASDFVTKPLRPAELVAAIDRAMEKVRLQQERSQLLEQVQSANKQLEARVRELTYLAEMGRTLTAMRSIDELFEVILNITLELTQADHATIILREPDSEKLRLYAGKNLTLVMQEKLGEIIRDDVADLILTSQQPLVAAGEGLQRFKISREIRAVIYVPMIAHDRSIGVLTAGNHRKRAEFEEHHTQMLKILADYAAIGITQARLFSALDRRARAVEDMLQAKTRERQHLQDTLQRDIRQPLLAMQEHLALLSGQVETQSLAPVQAQLQAILQRLQGLDSSPPRSSSGIYRIPST
ncbi:MAG: response regulator [Anaerolineae bacterium]|nr:response regulator [Anaerolineae bacterium]